MENHAEEKGRPLSKKDKEALGIKRDYTKERRDRVIPLVSDLYAYMAEYPFAYNLDKEDFDDQNKIEREEESYIKFMEEKLLPELKKRQIRYDDMPFLQHLTFSAANMLSEVWLEATYNERVVSAAKEIMEALAKEENITPSEKTQMADEEMIRLKDRMNALYKEAEEEKAKPEEEIDQIKLQDLHNRVEKINAKLHDLIEKKANGFVIFKDIMHRVVPPVLKKHDIAFYETASVFYLINNTVNNVFTVAMTRLKNERAVAEEKLWGIHDPEDYERSLKNDLTVEKVLDTAKGSE